jgi:hypothetical protein
MKITGLASDTLSMTAVNGIIFSTVEITESWIDLSNYINDG